MKITNNIILFNNDEKHLNKYSESKLKIFQNKRTESIEILQSLLSNHNIEISNKIKYELAILQLAHGDIQHAIETLNSTDQNTAYTESATLLEAEIYDYILEDKSKAVELYLFLLEQFPNSIHYESIRLRLRELTS